MKLQALLAKGAALGMHFIFASQGFTSGTRGLNDFSKKQVQQRIAMKTELDEIKATLDLTSASGQDYALMEQLPVHKALTRIPVDEFGNHLCLANVLFISDYGKQEKMIDRICENMQAKPKYDVEDIPAYIYKQPMVIDGNSYHSFADQEADLMEHLLKNGPALSGEDILEIFWGEPRRMMHKFPVQIANAYGENVFLLAPVHEKEAALSVLLSFRKSLDMQLQYGVHEIWAYRRNGIYQELTGRCGWRGNRKADLGDICQAIRECRKAIKNQIKGRKFFVLLGFETLMMEMENLEESSSTPAHAAKAVDSFHFEFRKPGKPVEAGEDLMTQLKKKRQERDTGAVDAAQQQKAGREIFEVQKPFAVFPQAKDEEDLLTRLKKKKQGGSAGAVDVAQQQKAGREIFEVQEPFVVSPQAKETEEAEPTVYDAREDLKYILAQGPRLGYHFLVVFNTIGEYKQTRLPMNLFAHKLFFCTSYDGLIDLAAVQGKAVAALTDHSFRYISGRDSLNFRPFLHEGLSLDGWRIGEDGKIVEEVLEEENYLL